MADTIIEKEGFKNLRGKTDTHEHKTAMTKGITDFQQMTSDLNLLGVLQREENKLREESKKQKEELERLRQENKNRLAMLIEEKLTTTEKELKAKEEQYQKELYERAPRIKKVFNQERVNMEPRQIKTVAYNIAQQGIDTSTKPEEKSPSKERIRKTYEAGIKVGEDEKGRDIKVERSLITRLANAIDKFTHRGIAGKGEADAPFPEEIVLYPKIQKPIGPIAAKKRTMSLRRPTLPGEDIKQ